MHLRWAKKNGVAIAEVDEEEDVFTAFVAVPEKRFFCPLTKQIMEEPNMISKLGHNYERAASLNWRDEE